MDLIAAIENKNINFQGSPDMPTKLYVLDNVVEAGIDIRDYEIHIPMPRHGHFAIGFLAYDANSQIKDSIILTLVNYNKGAFNELNPLTISDCFITNIDDRADKDIFFPIMSFYLSPQLNGRGIQILGLEETFRLMNIPMVDENSLEFQNYMNNGPLIPSNLIAKNAIMSRCKDNLIKADPYSI